MKIPFFWRRVVGFGILGAFMLALGAEGVFLAFSVFAMGPLPFEDDFASGDLRAWSPWAQQACCAHSKTVASAPDWPGKNALRMQIRYGDPKTRNSIRSELRLRATDYHVLYEYELKTFIPEDWGFDSIPVLLVQMHNVPDNWKGEWGLPPPLDLQIVGEEWVLGRAYGPTPNWLQKVTNIEAWAWWKAPLQKGRWSAWVFRVRWSGGEDGLLEVEKDGVKIATASGPNAYDNLLAPYLKFGVYVPGWSLLTSPPQVSERTAYFTDVVAKRLP